MITTPMPQDSVHKRLLLRGLAAAGLAGIALIHLEQLPETWRQTPLLGAMYAALVVVAAAAAIAVVARDGRLLWLAVFLIAAGPAAGYAVTRSQAVFFDDQDVGNWLEPLGLVSLFVELSLMGICAGLLMGRPVQATAEESAAGGLGRRPETSGSLEAAESAGTAAP